MTILQTITIENYNWKMPPDIHNWTILIFAVFVKNVVCAANLHEYISFWS